MSKVFGKVRNFGLEPIGEEKKRGDVEVVDYKLEEHKRVSLSLLVAPQRVSFLNRIDHIFLVSGETALRAFMVWVVLGLVFLTSASQSPESSFTRLGERLPYLTGFFSSLGHAFAGNEVQANRAVSVAVVSFLLVHGLTLIFLMLFFQIIKFLNWLKQDKCVELNRTGVRRMFVIARILAVTFMCFGAIGEAVAKSSFPKTSSSVETKRLNWMKTFENKSFFDLFIPGSHDSGAIVGEFTGSPFFFKMIEPLSATNFHTITEQLEMGIRYIDIRLCGAEDGKAFICHGPLLHYGKFEDILVEINEFVERNPTEIVVVYAKPEGSQFVSNQIEKTIYQPIILNYTAFVDKFISPDEALRFTLKELVEDGKNIIFGSDGGQSSEIFEDTPNFWSADLSPNTFFEDFYFKTDLFTSHLTENVCTGTRIKFGPNEGEFVNFTESVSILHGEISGEGVLQVFHMMFPFLAANLIGGTHLEGSSLEDLAGLTNSLLIELLSADECTGYQDFNIITHDFINDDIIELIISKNIL